MVFLINSKVLLNFIFYVKFLLYDKKEKHDIYRNLSYLHSNKHHSKYYKDLDRDKKSHILRFKEGSASLDACKSYLEHVGSKEAEEMLNLIRDMKFTVIKSIEHLEKRPTMDIEVFTKDHSYIVGNLVCHNSGGDIMMLCQPKIDNDTRLQELGCSMRLQVHDRLICRG